METITVSSLVSARIWFHPLQSQQLLCVAKKNKKNFRVDLVDALVLLRVRNTLCLVTVLNLHKQACIQTNVSHKDLTRQMYTFSLNLSFGAILPDLLIVN